MATDHGVFSVSHIHVQHAITKDTSILAITVHSCLERACANPILFPFICLMFLPRPLVKIQYCIESL